jgi:hypothetical protein
MPHYRTCLRCDAPVYCPPSEAALGKGKYCSRACRFGPLQDRFWKRVEPLPTGCWRWTGQMLSRHQAYGRISWEGRLRLAHHVSWLLHRGEIPEGLQVRHVCPGGAQSWCVNPDHLALGTAGDNAKDMLRDGRHWSQTGAWAPPRGIRLKPPHCATCTC